jgi:D-sedoheptulose 7-phosphate isomerase
MIPVAGEPFIAHQLRLLKRKGAEHVVLCIGHLGQQIRDFVGDGAAFGLKVSYSSDEGAQLGTGGALRRALPLLGLAFVATYGDSYLDTAIAPIILAWRRCGKPALLTVFRNEDRWDASNIVYADGKLICYDKHNRTPGMRFIDWGMSVLTHSVFAEWPPDKPFDLADVYNKLSKKGLLAGYEVTRRFFEIGSPAGLIETEAFLQRWKMAKTDFSESYYEEVQAIAQAIDIDEVEKLVDILVTTRAQKGRLFILGVGGGAGHAGHAVNDFRKTCGFEAYAPTDNVSELTARINDDGWATSYANWLRGSKVESKDCVLIFSVGGGNREKNISVNLIEALDLAKSVGASIIGIVGGDGGHTRRVAHACLVIPSVNPALITSHTEAFQAVVWHGLVSHPKLLVNKMKWESVC